MQKKFTLIETIAVAGVFSYVFFSYGFFVGRESARKQLGSLIDDLRSGNSTSNNEKSSQLWILTRGMFKGKTAGYGIIRIYCLGTE